MNCGSVGSDGGSDAEIAGGSHVRKTSSECPQLCVSEKVHVDQVLL